MALAGLLSLAVLSCAGEHDAERNGAADAPRVEKSHQALIVDAPGARVTDEAGVVKAYGAPLARGASPEEAVQAFLTERVQALGVSTSQLTPVEIVAGKRVRSASAKPLGLMFDRSTGTYKFHLYRHAQVDNGVPVVDAEVLTLVKNAPDHPVVWSSSTVKNLGGFTAPARPQAAAPSADKTLRALRSLSDFTGRPIGTSTTIKSLGTPEVQVFAGRGATTAAPRLAMTYSAETENPPGRWRLIADAATGDVLEAESEILFDDVVGSVEANVTQGHMSMDCAEELPTPLEQARVEIEGGSTALTLADGTFVLSNPGTAPVTVRSPLSGTFFQVQDYTGTNELLQQSVTPPGPADFLHNPLNANDVLRAQSNGYANAMEVRSFLLGYLPDYPTISTQVNFPVYVNRTDFYCPGNAWYDGSSINFCQASATYGNTSFASISQHEYGHHIVQMGGSGQGAYGEGMSDTIAALLAQDPGLGYGFYLGQCSSPLRTADNDCQYSETACSSCGSEAHACGNLISGAIWSIREQLLVTEPTEHEALLNSLVLSSVPMHVGSAINSQIAIDLLTLDDDDGLLGNGTPHYAEICAGFQAHGMTCPPILEGLSVTPEGASLAEGPSGGPFAPESFEYSVHNLGPEPTLDYAVSVLNAPSWLTVVNGSGQAELGEPAIVTLQIDQDAAALLPKGSYTAIVQFENASGGPGSTSRNVQLRVGVPEPVFSTDFEDGLGGFVSDGGTTNLWHLSTACASALAGHSPPTALYFGADASCTFDSGAVSGTITSPSVHIANTSVLLLRQNYFLATEQNPSFDRASIQVSVNGGAFVTVASNHGTGTQLVDGTGAWQYLELDLTSLVSGAPAADVQVRFGFTSGDSVLNGFTGFVIDDVQLRAQSESCTNDADCDDELSCSGVETCVNGSCVAGTPVSCDDAIACTLDSCDELTSCVNLPQDAACSDGDVCTGLESCDPLSGCLPGTPLSCDDGDPCTVDACDAVAGCTTEPLDCDDGDACTADACDPVLGCTTSSLDCDDDNECTADSCDAELGCVNEPLTGSCTDDGDPCTDDVCSDGVCTHPDAGTCGPQAFVESGGMVVMEAEHFHEHLPRSNHGWDSLANGSASGGSLLRANPNTQTVLNTGYVTSSPELRYDVDFSTTGTYYVWVRGSGPTADDDSCHVGIDGAGPASADRISSFQSSLSWSRSTMDGPVATLNVASPGVHTVSVWMREDGFSFDKLVLTTNAAFTPTGLGPAESPQGDPGPECSVGSDCDDANPCTVDSCTEGSCSNTAAPNGSACPDDGNACTNDVCNAGVCTHPDNGSCPSAGPCANFCSNPTSFPGGNYNSGNLGTNATCHETTGPVNGGVCGNLAPGRVLRVNGQQVNCNGAGWTVPPKVNGGYCVTTTAGNYPWAYFVTW